MMYNFAQRPIFYIERRAKVLRTLACQELDAQAYDRPRIATNVVTQSFHCFIVNPVVILNRLQAPHLISWPGNWIWGSHLQYPNTAISKHPRDFKIDPNGMELGNVYVLHTLRYFVRRPQIPLDWTNMRCVFNMATPLSCLILSGGVCLHRVYSNQLGTSKSWNWSRSRQCCVLH
jgi:hypothetical protein